MHKKYITFLLLLTAFLIGCAYPAASWQYVQQQRSGAGLAPLEWDGSLAQPAQARAEEIARLGALDHGGFQAMHDTLIPDQYLCEIIGRQPTWEIKDAVGWGWVHSPRHRTCALGAEYRRAAVGYALGADGWIYEAMWLTP